MNLLATIGCPLFLIAAVEFLLGFLLLRRNTNKDPVIRSATLIAFFSALYALSGGVAYTRAAAGLSYDLFLKTCWIGWFAIPAALQFLYYAKDSPRVAAVVGWVLYPVWTVILVLGIFTNWFEAGAISLVPYVDRTGLLENPARSFAGGLLLWGVVEMLRVYRYLSGTRRVQFTYFLLGLLIYAVCATLGANIFQLFGGVGFDPALASYFSIFWVAPTFYAITRHRLFDIKVVISHALAAISIFVALAAVHVAVYRLLSEALGSDLAVLVSLLVIGLLIFGTPLSSKVNLIMEKLLLGDKYAYQEVLKDSTRAMISILNLEDLLCYVVDVIQKSLKVNRVCVFSKDDDGVYRLLHGSERGSEREIFLHDGAIEWVEDHHQTLILEEFERSGDSQETGNVTEDLCEIGAELVIPMFFKGEMKGALTLGPKGDRRPFVRRDIELLEALAGQAAIAIENARLYDQAIRDSLTGLFHHRYLQNRLVSEIERSSRYGHPLSLLMIDVDGFKTINDERGHLVGDKVLKGIAGVLQAGARLGDLVARYGGDEFAVLLAETGSEVAFEVADRIRDKIERVDFDGFRTSVSIGVASTETALDKNSLITQADDALYLAKRKGKNRVELAKRPARAG